MIETSKQVGKITTENVKVNGILARARKIVKGQVKGENTVVKMFKAGEYSVVSSDESRYDVVIGEYSEECSCPAWVYGNGVDGENRCKHVHAVLICIKEKIEIKQFDELMEESD